MCGILNGWRSRNLHWPKFIGKGFARIASRLSRDRTCRLRFCPVPASARRTTVSWNEEDAVDRPGCIRIETGRREILVPTDLRSKDRKRDLRPALFQETKQQDVGADLQIARERLR